MKSMVSPNPDWRNVFIEVIRILAGMLKFSVHILLFKCYALFLVFGDEVRDHRPNFLIILMDDMGWADLGVQDPRGSMTPNMDALAQDGIRFTDFYVTYSVCTPSRAALLTGRYPVRYGLTDVLFPESRVGLPQEELTLAERLAASGYRTGYFGKWHLGHLPEFLPVNQGFDSFNGTPFSNDMSVNARFEGDQIVDFNPDQRFLTRKFTEAAIEFIIRHKDEPFFAVLSHPMPHIPLFVSPEFEGASGRGLYGDVLAELDWSVGALRASLLEQGVDQRTVILLLSDNGPWLAFADHGGQAVPMREGKFSSYEGGFRVPAIAAWPGHFQADRVLQAPVSALDIVPTFLELADLDMPVLTPLDGISQASIWLGADHEANSERIIAYWDGDRISAIRKGAWKLLLPGKGRLERLLAIGWPGAYPPNDLALYKLDQDISEQNNLAGSNPIVVEELMQEIARIEALLLDQRRSLPRPFREPDLGITDNLAGAKAPPQPSQAYRKLAIRQRMESLGLTSP